VFRRQAVFTPAECGRIAAQVKALEPSWARRHEVLPSFTLGAAAYLDIPTAGLAAYRIRTARINPALRASFDPMYGALLEGLAQVLGAPTGLSPRLALPGFHLFLHHPLLAQLMPSLHFDLQWNLLRWREAEAAPPEHHRSFTVLIEAGEGGAGLWSWPIAHDPDRNLDERGLRRLVEGQPPVRHDYVLGEVFVHSGRLLHQIDPERSLLPGQARITLQGHAFFLDGTWILYW
jgi:hypothetical protein